MVGAVQIEGALALGQPPRSLQVEPVFLQCGDVPFSRGPPDPEGAWVGGKQSGEVECEAQLGALFGDEFKEEVAFGLEVEGAEAVTG